jgi:hypothetical protein
MGSLLDYGVNDLGQETSDLISGLTR